MFGLGIGEILVILIIALVVFGPDKLPEIARTLGKSMAELRRSVDEFKHEITMPRVEPPAPLTQSEATPRPESTSEHSATVESNDAATMGTCEDKKS